MHLLAENGSTYSHATHLTFLVRVINILSIDEFLRLFLVNLSKCRRVLSAELFPAIYKCHDVIKLRNKSSIEGAC